MIDGWKSYTSTPIEFKSDLDTTFAIFHLESATEQAVILFCHEQRTSTEIMEHLGLNHREHFRSTILNPLIEKGIITLTIPEKPTSPNQKYIANSSSM